MSVIKVKDISVKVGTYAGANGEEKGRYRNIGAIMRQDDGREFMMLDVMALDSKLVNLNARATKRVEDKIMCSLFDPRPPGGRPATSGEEPPEGDDIPF